MRSRTSIFAIGDSITHMGHLDQGVMTNNLFTPSAYLMWATLFSQGRLVHSGVAATGGFTSGDVLVTHVSEAIAAKPCLCVVLAGVNDAQRRVPLATTVANLAAVYDRLEAAGIEPIMCTVTPKTHATAAERAGIAQINDWVKREGHRSGRTVVDLHAAVTDTAGNWLPDLTDGGLHPSPQGARAIGRAIADAVAPAGGPLEPLLVDSNDDPRFALPGNQLFLVDSDGDGLPDGWRTPTNSPVVENPADDAILGRYTRLTRTAADSYLTLASGVRASPGDVLYLAFRLASTVEANGGAVTARWMNTGANQVLVSLNRWMLDIPDGSVLAVQVTVPDGLSGYTFMPQVVVAVRPGAQARVGQLTALNLTALGNDDRAQARAAPRSR